MLSINIKIDSRKIERALTSLVQRQLPFATAMAINDVAREARADLRKKMGDVFVEPVPRTLNSVRLKLATKAKPEAKIWIDDEPNKGIAPEKYLSAEILGGQRHAKRFEKALQAAGIMPPGTYAVPGAAAPLDGNGNIPGPFIVQLLSYFQSFGQQGYRANMTAKRMGKIHNVGRSAQGYKTINGVAYFVSKGSGRNTHLKAGIYQKSGTHGVNVQPVIMFVRAPNYTERLPFAAVVANSVQKNFYPKLNARIERALATAR